MDKLTFEEIMIKKTLILCSLLSLLTACGYSSLDNELVGQVKKIHSNTPIFCRDYKSADISLGVMRNGVGSMSVHDMQLFVKDDKDYEILRKASELGNLVKVRYNERRITFCIPSFIITSVEVVN